MMRLRHALATMLASATLVAGAARAQDTDPTEPSAADEAGSHAGGYRVSTADGGFELVEHGVWESRDASVATARPLQVYLTSSKPAAQRDFRRAAYLPLILAAEIRYSLPVGLLDAVVFAESRYNPLAVSRDGAVGLGQLMPLAARELGIVNRFDPRENLEGSARYLRRMLDRFGMVHLALAAYNAGPRAVERAGGIPHNLETPAYVREVLRRWRF